MRILITMFLIFAAAPASAGKVLNMDRISHTIVVEQANSAREYTIQPGASVRWVGTDSKVSLASGKPMPSRGRVHADGLLSGTIGSMRNQGIPAGPSDELVIWPGSQLHMQRRMKGRDGF